jgi:hypothetical protein
VRGASSAPHPALTRPGEPTCAREVTQGWEERADSRFLKVRGRCSSRPLKKRRDGSIVLSQ